MTSIPDRGEVKLLRWPAESAKRERYRMQGVLRLLVIEGGVAAPVCADVREDWVRAPITDSDLMVRVATLQAKAEAHRRPQVDPYGVVRFAGRTSTVSHTETDLLECLVRQFGQPVPREVLHECLPDRPGGTSRNALDLHIMRVRRRIAPLGLVIRTVWGRGYLLEEAGAQPVATGGGASATRKRQHRDTDVDSATGRPLAAAEVAALRWAQANADIIRPAAS